MKRWKRRLRRWMPGRQDGCAYCRSQDPRRILCRGGGVVKIVAELQMAVFVHSWKSDQFDVFYCPRCGRKLR